MASMINNRKELRFYISADRIMNGRQPKASFKEGFVDWLLGNPPILRYLKAMRCTAFYESQDGFFNNLKAICYGRIYQQLGTLLGFTIDKNVLGYGVCIPHYGTVIIGSKNKIGNFAVIHTSTCITEGHKVIGDALYLSAGAKIVGDITLGDGVSVSVNSVVNCDYGSNVLLAGAPAIVKKENYQPWYIRDGEVYVERVRKVESLRKEMGL